jgi:5-enolpyruvylshikimate-3-phosphate synthase
LATSALSEDKVILHHILYGEDCLKAACEAYKAFAVVSVERGDGYASIVVAPAPGAPDPATVRREFLNYVLDLSIKKYLAS